MDRSAWPTTDRGSTGWGVARQDITLDALAIMWPAIASRGPETLAVAGARVETAPAGWQVGSYAGGSERQTVDLTAIVCAPEWPCVWARAVVSCESSWRPGVVNPAGPYVGLYQIWIGHGYTVEQLKDPVFNTSAAYKLWLRQGRDAWPNCG